MLAMQKKSAYVEHDISYYAKDSRLTGEPNDKRNRKEGGQGQFMIDKAVPPAT